MFPYDSRDYSRKRKFIEVGNTSTDPFGLNVEFDAFHGRKPNTTLYPTHNIKNIFDHRPIKSFTSLLLDGIGGDDDDEDYFEDYKDEKDDNLDGFRKKFKGQVMPLEPLMESDHKTNPHDWKNEPYGHLWSLAISQAEEKLGEKDAQMHKLSRDLYEKRKQLVSSQFENMLLKKKTQIAVNKMKSLRKTLKEELSRPRDERHEDDGESSFVGTKRHEAEWLRCKVCDARMANMIMCPCKHMSVCRRCDDTITMFPVCKAAKISSVEVCLT